MTEMAKNLQVSWNVIRNAEAVHKASDLVAHGFLDMHFHQVPAFIRQINRRVKEGNGVVMITVSTVAGMIPHGTLTRLALDHPDQWFNVTFMDTVPGIGQYGPITERSAGKGLEDYIGDGHEVLSMTMGPANDRIQADETTFTHTLILDTDQATADQVAGQLRNPEKGIHAQAVKTRRAGAHIWDVRLVINVQRLQPKTTRARSLAEASQRPEIHAGDFVKDPLDGELREVENVADDTVYLVDGGVMSVSEVSEVQLPSEALAQDPPEDWVRKAVQRGHQKSARGAS